MEERTSLLQEKAQLQAGEAELKSRLAVLEGSVETLQQNLSHSNTEMETLRGTCVRTYIRGISILRCLHVHACTYMYMC